MINDHAVDLSEILDDLGNRLSDMIWIRDLTLIRFRFNVIRFFEEFRTFLCSL